MSTSRRSRAFNGPADVGRSSGLASAGGARSGPALASIAHRGVPVAVPTDWPAIRAVNRANQRNPTEPSDGGRTPCSSVLGSVVVDGAGRLDHLPARPNLEELRPGGESRAAGVASDDELPSARLAVRLIHSRFLLEPAGGALDHPCGVVVVRRRRGRTSARLRTRAAASDTLTLKNLEDAVGRQSDVMTAGDLAGGLAIRVETDDTTVALVARGFGEAHAASVAPPSPGQRLAHGRSHGPQSQPITSTSQSTGYGYPGSLSW